jgi:septal ring factor EnvC (AmiA/AmiB activator)
MAVQIVTLDQFEQWQDNLTGYLDKKFAAERIYADRGFNQINQQMAALSNVVLSIAQTQQEMQRDIIEMKRDIADIKSDLKVSLSMVSKHEVYIRALIKTVPQAKFAANLQEVEDELDA